MKIKQLYFFACIIIFYSCANLTIQNFIGFKLPKCTVIKDSKDSSFTGEGYVLKILSFEGGDFKEIYEKANKFDFKEINNKNLINEGFLNSNGTEKIFIPGINLKEFKGLYKIKSYNIQDLEFEIALLDSLNSEITYYKSF